MPQVLTLDHQQAFNSLRMLSSSPTIISVGLAQALLKIISMARLKIVILITIVFLILMTLWWASSLAKARANTEQRLGDIHQIQQALRYYFEENGLYPYGLGLPSGIGAYIDHWPIPPEAIGACRTEDNVYFYAPQNSRDDYSVTFCLGVANEGFGAGLHTLSVKGIK